MLFRSIVNSTKLLFLYLLIQPPSPKIKIPQNSNVNSNVDQLKINFQVGVDSIYDACVAKGSTPASKSLSDVVSGINNIETGSVDSSTSGSNTVRSFTYTPKYKVSYVVLCRGNADGYIEIKSITGDSFSKIFQTLYNRMSLALYKIAATNNGKSPITMSFICGSDSDCHVMAFY